MPWTKKKGTNMKTVFIVDDEISIQTLVAYNFEKAGFRVVTEVNGKTALERLTMNEEPFDAVILDIMLPGLDGLEICKRLRQLGNDIPVILLTARDEEIDRILGLEIGADDYVTKPFSPRELVARVKSTLRRVVPSYELPLATAESVHLSTSIVHKEIVMNLQSHEVSVQGRSIDLTPKEFDLLKFMLEHSGQALSRDFLSTHVWGFEDISGARIVDVHVSHLRDKIEPNSKVPIYIKTVRGIGYKLAE
jgi:two-component system, OmpR family, alkaline phosphatase synthesis response regulator PhoP